MEKWVLVVHSNCSDPAREDEFNDWYNNIHLPDLMENTDFVRASRFVNPDSSAWESGKYLAIYEIETEDISQTSAAMEKRRAELKAQGRTSELSVLVSGSMYRQIRSIAR